MPRHPGDPARRARWHVRVRRQHQRDRQHGRHQREGGTGDHQVCLGKVPAGGGHQPGPEQRDQG